MKWKKFEKLTEAEFDDAYPSGRLIVWNSCNGPHQLTSARDGHVFLWELMAEPWEKYMVLPEGAR